MSVEAVEGEEDLAASSRFLQGYQDLRALLVAGQFEPGARLTEAELTQLLDISRGTLRSVIVRLVQEGYLTREQNRGVRARLFSLEEALAVLEAREILESAIAAKCAECATNQELKTLDTIWAEMGDANYMSNATEYSKLNRRFHQHIRDCARQPILSSFIEQLVYPLVMRQYRDQTTQHPRPDSLGEHHAIVTAIQTRNPEGAAAAMRHHIATARKALLINTAGSAGSTT